MSNAPIRIKALLLHGWGSSHKSWARFKEILDKNNIELVIPDMPGFGENPPPPRAWHGADYENWVLEFIREQRFQIPIIFIGHSFGGGLAMQIAINHPELVDKLILVAAARMYVKKSLYKKAVSRIAKLGKKVSPYIPYVDLVRKAFYKLIVGEKDYTRVSGIMRETFVNIIKEDVTSHIQHIKAPTLIVWGSRDNATPLINAHLLEEKIVDSRLEIIKGAGHALNIECPEKIAKPIIEFIKNKDTV